MKEIAAVPCYASLPIQAKFIVENKTSKSRKQTVCYKQILPFLQSIRLQRILKCSDIRMQTAIRFIEMKKKLKYVSFRQNELTLIHLYGVFKTIINSIAYKCVANAYFIYPGNIFYQVIKIGKVKIVAGI